MPSDVELMQRAAGGDPEAFAEIYDRHAGALLTLAQRLSPSASEALDLLHDVFLEAWQHVRQYDASRAAPRTWLIVRLRSRAFDRRARLARASSVATMFADWPRLGTAPARSPSHDESQRRDIAEAVSALDPDVRRVLELTYFEGLTAVEISELDQVPIGTVRSRLARGLAKLRELLDASRGVGDE